MSRMHMQPITNHERARLWVKAQRLSFRWQRALGLTRERRRISARLIYHIFRFHGDAEVQL